MSIAHDREELDKVRDQIEEILETGQSYSFVGGHTVSLPTIDQLKRREGQLRARIMRRKGYAGRIG